MRRGLFSLSDLPAWCVLNDVSFIGVKAANISGKGYGLVAEKDLVNEDENSKSPILLTVPKELILSAEAVEEYAKESKYFRQLLDVAGHQSTRCDALLFLLVQLVLSSPDYEGGQGPSTPWTQYLCLLPEEVSTPTMWNEAELSLLRGTSLEPVVPAKLITLTKEFDDLRAKVAKLPFWNELLSIDEAITVKDWILLDALYRSRSLGLPKSGESMVPCLDLVNHSSQDTAYWEENDKSEVVLPLCKGSKVVCGDEITIDYGHDKSPAEMLFNYGFIDLESNTRSLTLPLEPLEDDPLAAAKLHAFGLPPRLRLEEDESGVPHWTAPFMYLMCLNEEDGLEFRVLQETDGSRHLTVFWQGADITDKTSTIKDLIQDHELHQIFELRVLTTLSNIVQQKLEELTDVKEHVLEPVRAERRQAASYLRSLEKGILEKSLRVLNEQASQLLQDETVIGYLQAMAPDGNDITAEAAADEDDFS